MLPFGILAPLLLSDDEYTIFFLHHTQSHHPAATIPQSTKVAANSISARGITVPLIVILCPCLIHFVSFEINALFLILFYGN